MRRITRFHRTRLAQVASFAHEDPQVLAELVDAADGRRCVTVDPELFFPADGTRFRGEQLLVERRRVGRLCAGCPVRVECLAGALLRGETYGSWGGVAQPDYQVLQREWRDRVRAADENEDEDDEQDIVEVAAVDQGKRGAA